MSRNKRFKRDSVPWWVEMAIDDIVGIDHRGRADWFDVDDIKRYIQANAPRDRAQRILASMQGNGSSTFNQDRGLGTKYQIRTPQDKEYDENHRLSMVRLSGWKPAIARAGAVPQSVRKKLAGNDCAMCATCGKEVDHKDGRKEALGNDLDPRHYQAMCSTCNKQKRERCKRCQLYGKRPKAPAPFPGYTMGREKFDPATVGCAGCYWYDPVQFRRDVLKIEMEK